MKHAFAICSPACGVCRRFLGIHAGVTGFVISLLMIIWFTSFNVSAATPSANQVASDVASKIKNSSGVKAQFTIYAPDGQSAKGTLLSAGKKFRIMSASCCWYNGKYMWTLNPNTRETTVVEPSPAEVRESNPLLWIDGGGTSFDVAFAAKQPAGKYLLNLLPKRKNESVRKVEVVVNKTTLHPEKISVIHADGSLTTLVITSLQLNMRIGEGIFVYPREKYPGIKLVDLR